MEDYERNFNFSNASAHCPTDPEPDWPSEGFRQLTADNITCLPNISDEVIESYFIQHLGLDAGKCQALTKGKLLEQSNRLIACSMMVKLQETYISAICRAAMKKGVRLIIAASAALSLFSVHCCKLLLLSLLIVELSILYGEYFTINSIA